MNNPETPKPQPDQPQEAPSAIPANPLWESDMLADRAADILLGSYIIFPDRLPDSVLEPNMFHDVRHVQLYRTMREMLAEGVEINLVTLPERLARRPLVAVDWTEYVCKLAGNEIVVFNSAEYEQIIMEHYTRRMMMMEAKAQADWAYDLTRPVAVEKYVRTTRSAVWDASEGLEPQVRPEWIVDGLFAPRSLIIWYGEPGCKKTSSAVSLAACISHGLPWAGFATKKRRVLFIDEESGKERLKYKIGMTLRGVLADGSGCFRCLTMENFQLNDPLSVARMDNYIRGERSDAVFFDNLPAMVSGDENSKQDMQPAMTALRRLVDYTGILMTGLHHSGKKDIYRGSSAIKASVDMLVHMRSEEGSPFISFETEKNRDGEPKKWSARAVWVGDKQFYLEPCGRAGSTGRLKEKSLSKAQDFFLKILSEQGPTPLAVLSAAALEGDICSPQTARKTTSDLVKLGRIRRVDGGGRGVPAVYDLLEGQAEHLRE